VSIPEYPALQYRWQLKEENGAPVLVYYGLRNPPRNTRQVIALDGELSRLLPGLDGSRHVSELPPGLTAHPQYAQLVDDAIIVDRKDVRQPATRQSRRRCVRCVNDDHLLPGLEFDESGVCAFCQCYEASTTAKNVSGPQNFISEEELLERARTNTGSRFDAMVLCTGGKDSTYLLWLLSKKLGLRVLAAAWNMPYTNDTCRENLQQAVRLLPSVELVERTLPWETVRRAMREQHLETGLPCLCPFIAPALLFPIAVEERIPLILNGVDEVQLAVVNHVLNTGTTGSKAANPEPKSMRDQTLDYLASLVHAPAPPTRHAIMSDYMLFQHGARRRIPGVYARVGELLEAARSNPALPIPELRRLKTSACYGSWRELEQIITREAGWRMPPGHKGLLHTSCRIEQVKDHCQLMRFRNMRCTFFPQSIVEISAGVFFGMLTRDEALAELDCLGYSGEPAPLAPMLDDLGITEKDLNSNLELRSSLRDCSDDYSDDCSNDCRCCAR
jgi:hypothetical protein